MFTYFFDSFSPATSAMVINFFQKGFTERSVGTPMSPEISSENRKCSFFFAARKSRGARVIKFCEIELLHTRELII